MALTLTIENFTQLPDGGPLGITVTGRRGIDIGRDTYLDWTLPDPNMYISSKHCEVRYRDGAYWLHDVSLNGTFLDGAASRLQEPHRLRHGDRLGIGQYIIAVTLDADTAAQPEPVEPAARAPISQDDIWDFEGDVAPPVAPADVRPPKSRADTADFLDWSIDMPERLRDEPVKAPQNLPWPVEPESDWLPPPPPPPIPERSPARPHPDRPAWDRDEPTDLTFSGQRPTPFAPRAPDPPSASPSSASPGSRGTMTGPVAAPIPRNRAIPVGEGAAAPDFVRRFATAAGLPMDVMAHQDPEAVAELLGTLMGIVVEEMQKFLTARHVTKITIKCGDPTLIQAENNNPLKFAQTPQDSLRQMFGPPSRTYLDPASALRQGFDDLERHYVDTIAAMQGAVRMLIEDLDPREIERAQGGQRGLPAMLGSRKAQLWDAYVERWRAKAGSHDDGLLGAYMDYFAECYDRNVAKRT